MSRWAPDAALRLERAALELFAERGYAETTVPQIAERAGLTTRTFFRYFADKREVLFLREREFPTIVARLLAEAPAGLPPLELVLHGFSSIDGFEQWRDDVRNRRAVIRSDERLRERELLKSAALAEAIEQALAERGIQDAGLLARSGVLLFDAALEEWLGDDTRTLAEVLRTTLGRLRAVLG